MEDCTAIALCTLYHFSFASFTAGPLKRKDELCKSLTQVWAFFFFISPLTQNFSSYKEKANVFSKLDYTNSDTSSFWLKHFVWLGAVITLAPYSGWEAQIVSLILMKNKHLWKGEVSRITSFTYKQQTYLSWHRVPLNAVFAGVRQNLKSLFLLPAWMDCTFWGGCPRYPPLVWAPLPCGDGINTSTRLQEAPDGTETCE